ncbi:ANF_receptor domain-containing protein [Trichonephila inaurata madagascariensis]|uniref:ANF_receptor domain-containing protein n=1 Tax=Trichonephila inaurata madagascariensis TaxID=2747483 RepID=A0A8X6I7D3_9ARAC|nr:ANF_receptor domain-containing protein [Trichonephila inaurata madagascariensis]
MHIDENGDVEGNYTVLALQNAPQNLTLKGLGGEKNLSHLMLPIARFQYDGETGESKCACYFDFAFRNHHYSRKDITKIPDVIVFVPPFAG